MAKKKANDDNQKDQAGAAGAAMGNTSPGADVNGNGGGNGVTGEETRIVLFKNGNKRNDNDPDFTGRITIGKGESERTLSYVSVWGRVADSGLKYLSGVVNPPKEKQPTVPADDFLDDLDAG